MTEGPTQQTSAIERSERPKGTSNTLQQQVYDLIKTRIMHRELKPGEYVTDSEIADELGISRTPVVEALRLLQHELFVSKEPRQGWKVLPLTIEDIHEIFDLLEVVEAMVAGRAAECDDEEERAALRHAMERMKQTASAKDYDAWWKANSELHGIIFRMCGNKRARRMVTRLNEQWYRLNIGLLAIRGRIERSTREHDAIVKAIIAGVPDEAAGLTRIHIATLRSELVEILVNLVMPFMQNGV